MVMRKSGDLLVKLLQERLSTVTVGLCLIGCNLVSVLRILILCFYYSFFPFLFFFSKDWFLRYVYRAASAQFSIAGLQAIKWKNRRMINVDLSELVRPTFAWVFLRRNC